MSLYSFDFYLIMSIRKEDIKIKENIAVNEPKFNEKNTIKFNNDNMERIHWALTYLKESRIR